MILVVWTHVTVDHEHIDEWSAHETLEEASAVYEGLIKQEATYIASICGVIKSTDYDPMEKT